MSGTSTDGVDAVLAAFPQSASPQLVAQTSLPMPPALRTEFLSLNSAGDNELARAARAGNELAHLYAQACRLLLAKSGISASEVRAIGAHGQTVRHDPQTGYTIQINAPALLAELTEIDVVADFRARDVAAGGQGAPLVPAFHQAVFSTHYPRAILNLGGIANVTILEPDREPRGFDTGPANVLLDLWCHEQTGALFDADGAWAASGRSDPALLSALLDDEPWFAVAPPKSTGRDLFNRHWLMNRLARFQGTGLTAADIQATLQSLTAASVQQALTRYAPNIEDVLVCGGGALNGGLVKELELRLGLPVRPTSDVNIPVQSVEAFAFAWLAWAHIERKPAGLPSVTGARHTTILGACYPA